jgi:hypothetical protein
MIHCRSALLLAIAGLAAASATLPAQQPAAGRRAVRVPATVALADHPLNGGAAFLIQRRAGSTPSDVILLGPGATDSTLSAAITTLLASRSIAGDVPATSAILRMRPQQSHARPHVHYPWAGRVVADLLKAPRTEVEGVGEYRALEIWLPAQHPSRASRPPAQAPH